MKTKRMPKIMMIGVMMFSLFTPYQGVFAIGPNNDDGNGDSSTNRYLDYKLLDGVNELIEPSPVLPNGVDEKSYTVVVNHKAGELDGRDAKIQYRVTGAGGVEYKREMVLSGTVGTGFFPSSRLDNSFKFDLKFVRDGSTCASKEVCLPMQDAHYNLAVDVIFNAEDGTEQTFTSLSKTIYVGGEKGYQKDDTTNYGEATNNLQYNVYRIQGNGSLTGFSSVTYGELNSATPVPIYVDGYYKPESNIAVGKNIHIDYDIYAIESQSKSHLIKHFEQTQSTGTGTNYIQFNRTLHLSNEANEGNTDHSNYLDVAYLNNYPMNYALRVSVTVEGETKPRVVLDKPISVTDATYTKPNYVMNTSKALPGVEAGRNISFTLTNDTGVDIHNLDLSKLRTNEGIKGNMLGGILLPDIPVGKEVRVEYSLETFEEDYVQLQDKIVTKYIQNAETVANATGYNKEIYFRVGDKDPMDTRPVIYLKDYIADYVLKVDLIYGEGEQIKDTLYWDIRLVNDTVTHRIDEDEHAPYTRKNAYIDFDLNQVARNANGNIASRSPFILAPVSMLSTTPKELEIRGTLRSPSAVGLGQEFKIGYDVSAIEDYSMNTLVKGYIQDVNVRGNEVEFNRLFHLTTEQNQLFNGTKKDYVYVENYPSNYVVRVFLEDNTGRTHYFMDKQISLTNDIGQVQNSINYLLPQSAKAVPTFEYPTRLDVSLQQYDNAGNLKPFTEANAEEIKNAPLKLNIQSLLRNSDVQGTDMEIRFDIVSYESYLNPYVNTVMKEYKQNFETKTYHVEANRDIYISTNTRTDRSVDNRDSTLYLEDETQYYQLRVEVLKNGETYMKREVPFKINGINDPDHKAPQDTTGPHIDPNAPISTFLTDPNNSDSPTKRLQITARQLNSEDGIGVDLEGFIKKEWENQEVLIRYDLVALNTYTDYINGNGVTTTLESDPQAQPDDQNHYLVSSMEEWYGEPSQDDFLKRYQSTNYTKNNYEPFRKHFVLRTKLDQEEHGSSPSTWFLDNVARDYELTITATNTSTGEEIKETIELDITTVKANENNRPTFSSNTAFRQPARGSGYFEGEFMPVSFYAASDADNTQNQTEYIYYKVYYYYSTSNNDGSLNDEIQKYMLRYDDMPMGGSVLTTEWQVPMSAKIEPAYLRGFACDVNHVCSEATKSNPFKFNEFGIGDGNTGGGNTGGGVSANITISPRPSGDWESKNKEVFVNYEGAAELAIGAQKAYEITNSSTMPNSFSKMLTTSNKITITGEGENYVHVRYILSDGTELYTSSGPYRIYKSAVDSFTMKLVDAQGNEVTDWTNQPPFIKMVYSGNEADSGIVREYRIHNYHNEWHEANASTKVNVEGEQLIYGRMKNKAGVLSEQQSVKSKLDRSPVDFRKVVLTENETGKYDISVWAEDTLSGINKLTIVDNGTTKELEKSPTNALYQLNGLTNAPSSVTGYDNAGNEMTVTFTNKPTITFDAPYSTDLPVYRDTVTGKITNGVKLSYKLGNQTFTCGTQDPCPVSIDRNTLLTGINIDGIKQTNKEIRINNIDKKDLKLLLYGKRQTQDASKIELNWNYNIVNGTLICYENGTQKTFPVTGTGVILTGVNAIYDCQLTGVYGGETVVSNRVVIYPDQTQPVEGGGAGDIEIDAKIYVEESRVGTTYFINTKRENINNNYAPIPKELFE